MRRFSLNFAVGLLPLLAGVLVALGMIALLLSDAGSSLSEVAQSLYEGTWQLEQRRYQIVNSWMPLVLLSGGLLLTFSCGLWNIGIEGQLLMGAVGASLGALFLRYDDRNTQVAIQIGLAMASGSGWALLAAMLKTRGGVNEIFGGVALNFIAQLFAAYLVGGPWAPERGGTGSRTVNFDAEVLLPATQIQGTTFFSYPALYMTIGGFVLVGLLLYLTRFGLQLRATGKSPASAGALGVPVERNIWLAMALCGALAGVAGSLIVLYPPIASLSSGVSGGRGFLAILVVLLASLRYILVPFIAFAFAFLSIGALRLETQGIEPSLISVMQGLLVLMVLLFDGLRGRWQAARDRQAIAADMAAHTTAPPPPDIQPATMEAAKHE